jgi:uncharacterized phage protein (TIGR02218 family)
MRGPQFDAAWVDELAKWKKAREAYDQLQFALRLTGLAVDNTEAVGALSDEAVTEADINAGRFDGAEVTAWLVNWRDVAAREVQFKGSIGELKRADGAFHAELRGLSEVLNTPVGRVYQKPCQAVLGDGTCCVDLSAAGYRTEVSVEQVEAGRVFRFAALAGFDDRWFERGRLEVRSGRVWDQLGCDRAGHWCHHWAGD